MKNLTILITLLWTVSTPVAAQAPNSLEPRDKALIQDAFDGDLAEVRGLVAKGASVEAADSKGRTAFIWAASNGHMSVVEFLHGEGADINAKDSDGQTALMYATKRSFASTVEFLLENGADVNAQSSKRGITALIIAAAVGNENLVRLLLDHGADKNLADKAGNTAVDHARQNGYAAVVIVLEDPPAPASNS